MIYIKQWFPCFFYTFRSENKKNKMKKHEQEKEYMKSLKAVTITTKYSAGGCEDSGSDSEYTDSECEGSDEESSIPESCIPVELDSSDESDGELPDHPSPLYFLYDCEGTGGSVYKDHIVEIAAVLQPLPNNVETTLPRHFQSLVNTSKRIAAPGKNKGSKVLSLVIKYN